MEVVKLIIGTFNSPPNRLLSKVCALVIMSFSSSSLAHYFLLSAILHLIPYFEAQFQIGLFTSTIPVCVCWTNKTLTGSLDAGPLLITIALESYDSLSLQAVITSSSSSVGCTTIVN